MDKKRLLLICPNLSKMVDASHFFQGNGFAIGLAESVDDAERLFRGKAPHAVIFFADGFQALTQATRLPKLFPGIGVAAKMEYTSGDLDKIADKVKQAHFRCLIAQNAGNTLCLSAVNRMLTEKEIFFTEIPKHESEKKMDVYPHPATVYVIEDSLSVRKRIEAFLSQTMGHSHIELKTFEDAETFMIFAGGVKEKLGPSLFLIDWDLPGLSGMDLVQSMRQFPLLKPVPRILLTSVGSKERIVQAMQNGVQDILVKPFAPETLLRKLHLILLRAFPLEGQK